MARMTKHDHAVAAAEARNEGFNDARQLVLKLIDSGLSLTVAKAALDEKRDELLASIAEAKRVASAARRGPREKKPAAPKLTDPDPDPDPV